MIMYVQAPPKSNSSATFLPTLRYTLGECKQGEGLISTVSDDPPILNWIYADKDTLEHWTRRIDHIVSGIGQETKDA
jgi:hypothetical protein